MATKDKVISRLKNQNAKLITKIVKIIGDHDTTLKVAKSKSIVIKGEIDKFKAQINTEVEKNIAKLEAKISSTKVTYDNLSKDYTTLQ